MIPDTLHNVGVVIIDTATPPAVQGMIWLNPATQVLSISHEGAWISISGGGGAGGGVHVGPAMPDPADTVIGSLWLDTSTATPLLKIWTGVIWTETTPPASPSNGVEIGIVAPTTPPPSMGHIWVDISHAVPKIMLFDGTNWIDLPVGITTADISVGLIAGDAGDPSKVMSEKTTVDYVDSLGVTVGGTINAGKLIRLSGTGLLPVDMMPVSTIEFMGAIDASGLTTTAPTVTGGDFYFVSKPGTLDTGWGALDGTTVDSSDILINDGTSWYHIGKAVSLGAYLPLVGGSMADGSTVTFTNTTAGTKIIDGGTPANAVIDNVMIEGDTF